MTGSPRTEIRYEVGDTPPAIIACGLGLQFVALTIIPALLVTMSVFRAGGAEEFLSWGVFATMLTAGLCTILQTLRTGRVGAGYILVNGSSAIFIAVCATALAEGGPAMLATLVVLAGILQVVLSWRLSLIRRLITPTVTGTVLMLMPVSVSPILFDLLHRSPPEASAAAGPLCIGLTLAVVVGIGLKGTDSLRLWAPMIAVVAGSVLAWLLGIYDTQRVADAAWIGWPVTGWPGLDLGFGPAFRALLPSFLLLALIGMTKSIGFSVAVQRVSWRRPRAVDYRAVQGATAGEGVGNLLTGLLATVPNTPYPQSVSVTEMTGAAARSIGLAAGMIYVLLAFLPKGVALFLAIPSPVVGAALLVPTALVFVVGAREVLQSAPNYRTGLIVGVSFWTGVGFQHDMIFPEYFSQLGNGFLQDGMTSGGLTAMALVLLTQIAASRGDRFRGQLDMSELPRIREFLGAFAARRGWGAATDRLAAAVEETLQTLLDAGHSEPRRLHLAAREEDGEAVLELIVGAADDDNSNLQDRVAFLGEQVSEANASVEVSFRLLRHLASSIHHQQFHDMDVVTIRIDPGSRRTPTGC